MQNTLNIGENIFNLRRARKLTQEQLADFIGVTKASVSKWETGQSTPDILLLPRLAAYFDITVDELIGYRPQLTEAQIMKIYQELAAEYAEGPFSQVMDKTKDYVKKYYSCYPFLFQISVLWLNHYILAEEKEEQQEILASIVKLCQHIKDHCRDVGICNDSIVLQGIAFLNLGQAQKAVDTLKDMVVFHKLSGQGGTVVIQAYEMLGDFEKARSYSQASMYSAVFTLIGNAALYITMEIDNLAVCEKTISRIEKVSEAYECIRLHPNSMAIFEYQAALCYARHHEKEKALKHMEKYVVCLEELFSGENLLLHGDGYFNQIEDWLKAPMGSATAPRNRKLVIEDSIHSLSHPALAILEGAPEYERLKRRLKAVK